MNKLPYFVLAVLGIFFFILFFYSSDFEKTRKCRCIGPGIIGDIEQRFRIFLKAPVLLRSPSFENNVVLDYSKKIYYALHNSLTNDHEFEVLKIDIPFEKLKIIKQDRKKAMNFDRLVESRKVDIKIKFNNQSYNATARLKGDLPDHWQNSRQWSIKIKLKKNKTILSMNEFSLQIHSARDFPYNLLQTKIYKKYNLMIPEYETVNVRINGIDWGLMLMEENFGENFYFKNKIKEAPIFKMTNEKENILGAIYGKRFKNISSTFRWQGKIETKVYNEDKILKQSNIPNKQTNQNLLSIFKNIQEVSIISYKKYPSYFSEYIDIGKFAKVMAISSALGDFHSTQKNNARYYLNPYDLKVIPILTDQTHGIIDKNYFSSLPNLYKYLFTTKQFQVKYLETINEINKNFENHIKDTEHICNKYGKICSNLFDADLLKKNIEYVLNNNKELFNHINNLDSTDENKKILDTEINQDIAYDKIYFRIFQDGDVIVNNLSGEKLNIKNIIISKCIKKKCKSKNSESKNKKILINKYISANNNNEIKKINFLIDFKKNKYGYAKIFYSDEKNKIFFANAKIEDENLKPFNFFLKEKNQIPDFIKKSDKLYVIPKGNYDILNPIIIPYGFDLKVAEGTNLLMSSNSYIEVKNGAIYFEGSKDSIITIKSQKKGQEWKGIYVNSKNKKDKISKLNFVNISDTTYFDNQKIQLTGGINFINTKVNIFNTNIQNTKSEDAINFVNSEIKIDSLKFENIFSDAIDVDFGKAIIQNVSLKNIGGDGIDLSGSNVLINNFKAYKIADKAISVGEKSILKLDNIKIEKAKIGIASKDSSEVNGKNITISNCVLYDFAVYKKKNYFGGANMNLSNVKHCGKPLVQIHNKLLINDKNIKGEDFNIKKLYQ